MVMSKIQDKLKERLAELNMRPADLARKAQIPQSTVKNIIYGKVQQPREGLMQKIANVLSVSPEYLLYGIASAEQHDSIYELPWYSEIYKDAIDIIDRALHSNKIVTVTSKEMRNLVDQLYSYTIKKYQKNGDKTIDQDMAECLVKIYVAG